MVRVSVLAGGRGAGATFTGIGFLRYNMYTRSFYKKLRSGHESYLSQQEHFAFCRFFLNFYRCMNYYKVSSTAADY